MPTCPKLNESVPGLHRRECGNPDYAAKYQIFGSGHQAATFTPALSAVGLQYTRHRRSRNQHWQVTIFDPMPPILGNVQLVAACAAVMAALLLPAAHVGAFVTPACAGRWTAVARTTTISPSRAAPDSTPPSAPVATTAEAAKDNLKDALAASRGSTLGADVLAAVEVSHEFG